MREQADELLDGPGPMDLVLLTPMTAAEQPTEEATELQPGRQEPKPQHLDSDNQTTSTQEQEHQVTLEMQIMMPGALKLLLTKHHQTTITNHQQPLITAMATTPRLLALL